MTSDNVVWLPFDKVAAYKIETVVEDNNGEGPAGPDDLIECRHTLTVMIGHAVVCESTDYSYTKEKVDEKDFLPIDEMVKYWAQGLEQRVGIRACVRGNGNYSNRSIKDHLSCLLLVVAGSNAQDSMYHLLKRLGLEKSHIHKLFYSHLRRGLNGSTSNRYTSQ